MLFANYVLQSFDFQVIVTTILNKSLRHNRNAFIVSLAVADFMVASISMPASITGNVCSRRYWTLKVTTKMVFRSFNG